jgi:rhamnogalacturonyl hydrolase YesR
MLSAVKHSRNMYSALKSQPDCLPKTVKKDGNLETCKSKDWTSGFFPGTLWYLYEYTSDTTILSMAKDMTSRVEDQKYTTDNHDVGFIINCSFGNGLRLTGIETYKEILITSAKSLSTRFNPAVGCTRSWDRKQWQFPVIIDNMMNLELLCKASKIAQNPNYKKISIAHADKTMENHFRPDYSSYHLVDYDTVTGNATSHITYQGYANSSSWSRGQAWGLYGYTMMYRETEDVKYLEMAKHIANFIINHPRLPKDKIPYWDFDAPAIPNALRDASAGAIIASALLELSTYIDRRLAKKYLKVAEQQITSLASPAYMAKVGTNQNFILMHNVGFFAKNREVDAPLSYADYYFVEAMLRYLKLRETTEII